MSRASEYTARIAEINRRWAEYQADLNAVAPAIAPPLMLDGEPTMRAYLREEDGFLAVIHRYWRPDEVPALIAWLRATFEDGSG